MARRVILARIIVCEGGHPTCSAEFSFPVLQQQDSRPPFNPLFLQQLNVVSLTENWNLEALLAVTEVPGIAIAGVIDSKPFQTFAGVRASVDRVPITSDTWFSAASLSKPVFAWAVRDLVQKGKLDWEKPLQDYLDLGLSGEARQISAAHVLSHTTGLPNWRFQLDQPLASEFTPGARWQYSGEGYFLLQRVIESLVGLPIARHMKQAVLAPFSMANSTFAWTPELQKKAAAGHDRRGNPLGTFECLLLAA